MDCALTPGFNSWGTRTHSEASDGAPDTMHPCRALALHVPLGACGLVLPRLRYVQALAREHTSL